VYEPDFGKAALNVAVLAARAIDGAMSASIALAANTPKNVRARRCEELAPMKTPNSCAS